MESEQEIFYESHIRRGEQGLDNDYQPEDMETMKESFQENPQENPQPDGPERLQESFEEEPLPEELEIPQENVQEVSPPSDEVIVDEEIPQEPQLNQEFVPLSEEVSFQPAAVEVAPAAIPRKVALILSGGGARGAFQVGAEMYARQVKGYEWDIVAGVSVGALNGAMLAMHRYARLMEIWDSISDDIVYTGGFSLSSILKLIFGAKSFYSNAPLQKMMEREFEAGKVIDDLRVGAVSLISGDYVQFTKEFLELPSAILASSSIPVIWPPVDISPEHLAMVDGGVRNISPVGDVLEQEPDEIVIINCSREQPIALSQAPSNVVSIGMRALDILQNEIFVNDVKEFLRINDLVKEAQEQGATLHHPRTGKPYKYYPYVLIEPDEDLGEILDFSKRAVQKSLKAGVRRAREVLGRP